MVETTVAKSRLSGVGTSVAYGKVTWFQMGAVNTKSASALYIHKACRKRDNCTELPGLDLSERPLWSKTTVAKSRLSGMGTSVAYGKDTWFEMGDVNTKSASALYIHKACRKRENCTEFPGLDLSKRPFWSKQRSKNHACRAWPVVWLTVRSLGLNWGM